MARNPIAENPSGRKDLAQITNEPLPRIQAVGFRVGFAGSSPKNKCQAMSNLYPALIAACFISIPATIGQSAEVIPLGEWLQEDLGGIANVSGSGDSFTASPGAFSSIPDENRQRVYQTFSQAADFSAENNEIRLSFDVVFNSAPDGNDRDFRVTLLDTSTNQGFYAISFDLGGRLGLYNEARFVDQLDGEVGDDWGGTFVDALDATGTIVSTSTPPTVSDGATEQGLIAGNTLSFDVLLTRQAGDDFTFTSNVTEANGDVVYPTLSGSYDPVNPTSGDTSVAGVAIDQFDGVVFGIFDDEPFEPLDGDFSNDGAINAADYVLLRDSFGAPNGTLENDPNTSDIGLDQYQTFVNSFGAEASYTVSNIQIETTELVSSSVAISGLAIPEPGTAISLLVGTMALFTSRQTR